MNETDTEYPNLDMVIYDLVKAAHSMGGATNPQIYTGVRDATLEGMPVRNIDATINWLRDEGMIRPSSESDRWVHIDFEAEAPLP